ncbi:TPR-containing protein DDB_G0280363-like [Anastrepha obliqua]|uniref:TPR-containing protein DDB_G0280363-like n=1 Tax=Anastrepha obliqua TaxID=95512 RepID=UPI0024098308|nr:TPR-containing protein DDB_G0280363-like [Anastrepha obliqua]XP_054731966.1 TPR-containing protein DDB_G0280363-like [Anastrepha obliqua]
MEVLSVQNQYQGQFGVIGTSKVKDWTSPLTPPPPPPSSSSQLLSTSHSITSDNVAHNQRNGNGNNNRNVNNYQVKQDEEQLLELYTEDAVEGGDVVDGGNWSAPLKQAEQHYNHHNYQHEQRQQHFYYNNHHYGGTHHTNNYHHHNQPHTNNYHHYQKHQKQQQQYYNHQQYTTGQQKQAKQQKSQKPNNATTKEENTKGAFNDNMFYYEPPVTAAITPVGTPTSGSCFGSATTDVDIAAVNELAQRVQTELRDAKKRHLDCTEVSLPFNLMPRIAAEIIKASEREPCGVRGCSLYIDFECEPSNVRRIASFKVDDSTVSTFELYLMLKQDKSGWTSLLPQFIKNLTRSNTILVSPDFTLTKNKLYSCD